MRDLYDFDEYAGRIDRAAARVDLDASHAQREALNARVGRLHVHGLDIRVEWPKGATRTGVGADGREWHRRMYAHYGRLARTRGHDGDQVDVYIGDHPESQLVFVVSQLKPDGSLDEHKVCLCVRNLAEAKEMYLAHYPANWAETRLGEIRGMTTEQFKDWLAGAAPVKNRDKAAGADADVRAALAEIAGGVG